MGYFVANDKVSHEVFTSAARALHDDHVFGVTNDTVLAALEHSNVPGIAVYRHFEEEEVIFELTPDKQAMLTLVKAAATPSVIEWYPKLHFDFVKVCRVIAWSSLSDKLTMHLDRTFTWLHPHRDFSEASSAL